MTAVLGGGAIGLSVGWHMGVKAGPVFDLFAAAQFASHVSAVRHSGTDRAYEDALRSSLSLNRQLRARDPDPHNHRMYSLDSAVTLARLSQLAGKRGATDEANKFGAEAEALCPATGIRECSLAKLLEVAQFMDGGTTSHASK
jgi:hypothetical protein